MASEDLTVPTNPLGDDEHDSTSQSAQQWQRLEPILDELLDLPAADRLDHLDRLGLDAPLKRSLLDLLDDGPESDAQDVTNQFRQRVVGLAEVVLRERGVDSGPIARPAETAQIDNYRIVRPIGRGGMGEVFLAERSDGQFEQQVALKVIRSGLELGSTLERFLRERQILANLQHPGIARLLDGGLTHDGQPYSVMELVDGEPILDYCRRHACSFDQRLDLFLQICAAVAYAHRNLVVHRDLKPNNVLVNRQGIVKLLDFGIAKMLSSSGRSLETMQGARFLTPRYAAPEQIKGERITTATDVYGLGLLLYELLTDLFPYDLGSTRAEAASVIAEQAPQMASTALLESARSLPDADAVLRRRLEKAAKRLRGDLDQVILRALDKDPEQRYQTVALLVSDIQAVRENRPIDGSTSWLYLATCFLRRHWLPAAALTIAGTGLLLGVLVAAGQARLASIERDRAQRAQRETTAVNDFLVDDLLALTRPEATLGSELSVSDILQAAESGIESRLSREPVAQGRVRTAIGTSYLGLGDLERAGRNLERAYELLSEHLGEDDPDTLAAQTRLAELKLASGDVAGSRSQLEHATTRLTESVGESDLSTLRARSLLGEALDRAGRRFEAETLLRETRRQLEEFHPDAWRDRLQVSRRLTASLQSQRKSVEAHQLARETLELQERFLGEEHPDVAETLGVLADVLARQEMHEEAAAAAERGYQIRLRLGGDDHPETLAALARKADALYYLRRHDEARALYEQAFQASVRRLGPRHADTLRIKHSLAVVRSVQGDTRGALALWQEVALERRQVLGDSHPATLRSLRSAASALGRLGRTEEQARTVELVIDLWSQQAESPDVDATSLSDFAHYLLTCQPTRLRDPERALQLASRAVEHSGGQFPAAYMNVSRAHRRLGQLDQAIDNMLKAAEHPDALYLYAVERELVAMFRESNDLEAADRFLREHLERRRAHRPSDDPLLGTSLRWIGLIELDRDLPSRAEVTLRSALQHFEGTLGPTHYRTLEAASDLGFALASQDRLQEARSLLQRAVSGLEATARPSDTGLRIARERLAALQGA